jgi:hypothetical protein
VPLRLRLCSRSLSGAQPSRRGRCTGGAPGQGPNCDGLPSQVKWFGLGGRARRPCGRRSPRAGSSTPGAAASASSSNQGRRIRAPLPVLHPPGRAPLLVPPEPPRRGDFLRIPAAGELRRTVLTELRATPLGGRFKLSRDKTPAFARRCVRWPGLPAAVDEFIIAIRLGRNQETFPSVPSQS